MNLETKAQNFLLYSYFGIDIKDFSDQNKDEIQELCVHKAYTDLNRTITFNKKCEENERKKFRTDIEKFILDHITGGSDKNFDDLHRTTCEDIVKEAQNYENGKLLVVRKNNDKVFYYGQAQKWLNMSLKYMWLLNVLPTSIKEDDLHAPVDNYIIKAAKEIGIKPATQPWSKWGGEDYIAFQSALKEEIKNSDYKSVIEWECQSWIEAAKKENR